MDTPAIANARTLRDLEFERVKSEIQRFAASPLGVAAVEALSPTADLTTIQRELARVEEMQGALVEAGLVPGPMDDLEPILKRARESTSLSGDEFLVIGRTLESGRQLREEILSLEGSYTQLQEIAERVQILRELEGAIRRTFDAEGEIREDASPRLRQFSRRKQSVEAHVEERLRAFLNSPEYSGLIREPIITRRSSRLVIPIKSHFKHDLDCVVHDTSDSGQTLYIEPRSVVEANNEIRELESEMRDEKIRILKELTAKVQQESWVIHETLQALRTLDGIYARAQYALTLRCSVPRINTEGRIQLRNARHPLLDQTRVVPIDIAFGDGALGVLITGPNTGGKTVTLKTVGLLILMIQAGIPIPADPESELSTFERIRSDIGDEQSIQQNLSTFSSHMKNIVGILKEVNARSLVLLDELGAGTDPQEGAALGISILTTLLRVQARLIVTTHFSALKHFAYQHEQLKTCSVEFDVQTLRPTYRLFEGVGASNAFIIAERLGLPAEMVRIAQGFLSEGAVKAEEIIRLLERERVALSEERARLALEREAARAERERFDTRLHELESGKEELLRAELRETERTLKETRAQVEQALHQVRQKSEEELRADLKKLEEMQEELFAVAARVEERPPSPLTRESVHKGMRVRVEPLQQIGTVREIWDEGRVEVDIGGVRVQASVVDLSPAPPEAPKRSLTLRRKGQPELAHHEISLESPGLELHVRGLTVSEALREVDLYIDRLVLSDMRKAYIVHGKGTGTLRRVIREHLAKDHRVGRISSAPVPQGGEGITVVELR
jgi:DNA mismatch repair protein MutS2